MEEIQGRREMAVLTATYSKWACLLVCSSVTNILKLNTYPSLNVYFVSICIVLYIIMMFEYVMHACMCLYHIRYCTLWHACIVCFGCTFVCMHVCVCECVSVCCAMCMYVCMYVCVCMCDVYMYVCVCMYV